MKLTNLKMYIFVCLLIMNTCNNPNSASKGEKLKDFAISDQLVEQIKNYDYKSNPKNIILELERQYHLDKQELNSSGYSEAYLSITTANIDEDSSNEHLILAGINPANTVFYIVKKKGKKWYIIYQEDIKTHNSPPEIRIYGNYSRNKVFMITKQVGAGTGHRQYNNVIYRLIQFRVYKALNIVDQLKINQDNLDLAKFISSRISYLPDDKLYVEFDYSVYPSFALINKLFPNSNNTLYDINSCPIILDERLIIYHWNRDKFKYEIDLNRKSDYNKVKALTHYDIKKFIGAFKGEFKKLLKSKNKVQSGVAKYLLSKSL